MKYTAFLSFLCGVSSLLAQECTISLEPCWHNLESKKTQKERFGGKWILVGSIIFRKKSKDAIKLNKIKLHWHGEPLDRLSGSLYKKLPEKRFFPIEENHLCDSNWDRTHQMLILDFKEHRQTLGSLNIFYIVLTVPDTIEPILKKGYFSLPKSDLPLPFKQSSNNEITLNIAHFVR